MSDIVLSREDRVRLLRELATVFHTPERVEWLLDDLGWSRALWPSAVGSPETVWRDVLRALENGAVVDGLRALLSLALERYPANRTFTDLAARYLAGAPSEPPGGVLQEPPSPRGARDEPEPVPLSHVFVRHASEDERHRTAELLTSLGLGPQEVYSTNSLVLYALHTADAESARRVLEPTPLRWSVVPGDGPVYLLSSLIVQGPDGRTFRVTDEPAATSIAAIAEEVLAGYPAQQHPEHEQQHPEYLVDRVRPDGESARLDPAATLAEAGIQDGDRLRVGFVAQADGGFETQVDGGSEKQACSDAAPAGHVVLAVATEWSPGRGGLSSYNRRLCAALAADPAVARVFCQVPPAVDESDRQDAKSVGVELVDAGDDPGLPPAATLSLEPRFPDAVTPDVVIGHGRITGAAARRQAARVPGAQRAHLIHMAPDEIDWEKPSPFLDVTEARTEVELELGETAAVVGVVGRRTFGRFQRDLPAASTVIQLDPGFRDLEQQRQLEQQRRTPSAFPKVLLFGRLEDHWLKGVDIAAQALALAARRLRRTHPGIDVELLVRGATDRESTVLRDNILENAAEATPGVHHPFSVTARLYTTAARRLEHDLASASLVLMPSRAEAFGLVGVEAIEHGVPVLVSEWSGLADYLRGTLAEDDAAQVVVCYPDGADVVFEWDHRIWGVLSDPRTSFERAERIRRRVVADRPWSKVARELLEALDQPG